MSICIAIFLPQKKDGRSSESIYGESFSLIQRITTVLLMYNRQIMVDNTNKLLNSKQFRKRNTADYVETLASDEVFVFGSNPLGWHGGGAAAMAHMFFGAVWGQGVGLQGQSYAIPTVHISFEAIGSYVDHRIRKGASGTSVSRHRDRLWHRRLFSGRNSTVVSRCH